MAKPEATEHFPWGERAIKVKGKVFLFMYADASTFGLSCKLPVTNNLALMLPFAEPTGYGLGKAGWVSARFAPDEAPPIELLQEWIDESYRAVAPALLAAQVGTATPAKLPASRARPAKKPVKARQPRAPANQRRTR